MHAIGASRPQQSHHPANLQRSLENLQNKKTPDHCACAPNLRPWGPLAPVSHSRNVQIVVSHAPPSSPAIKRLVI